MSTFPALLRIRFLLTVSLLVGAQWHGVVAQDLPAPPEETGHFDGRLWRLGPKNFASSAMAVDDRRRLVLTGSMLGTDTDTPPLLARRDGRVWEALSTNRNVFGSVVEVMVAVETNLFAGGGLGRVGGPASRDSTGRNGIRSAMASGPAPCRCSPWRPTPAASAPAACSPMPGASP